MTGWGVAVLTVLLLGCGPKVVRHTVAPGDDVYGIARRYGVPYADVMRANRLRDPARLEIGRELKIPGAPPATTPSTHARGGITPIGFAPTGPGRGSGLQWPVAGGAVTSAFGRRESGHHDGIDVQAPIGTPVRAAEGGQVLFSGSLRGYGNLVIIDHGGGLATVYAHNQRNLVRAGARVRPGHAIATLGATGQTSGPHLHFEVRKHNVARDPLGFLPAMSVASRRTRGAP
jgi:murein DD-endopeptidase MepM/ murein hydrolase activator NlpD